MRAVRGGCGILLLLTLSNQTTSAGHYARLSSYPAETWMRAAATQLVIAAGRPTLAGESSELAARGELVLQPGLALIAGLGVLEAGGYREESVRAGLALGAARWRLRAAWVGARVGVESLAFDSRTKLKLSLAMDSGPLAVGVLQEIQTASGTQAPADQLAWALRWSSEALVFSLLREDARYGGDARWSLGLQFLLHPRFQLGLVGEDSQGRLLLLSRWGALGFRLMIPLASVIDAGPYFALEWRPPDPDPGP